MASVVAIGLLGASPSTILPAMLGTFAESRILTAAQLTLIAAAELAGTTLATFAVGMTVGRMPHRIAIRAALILAGTMHLLSSLDLGFGLLFASRFAAGLGEGALIALAVAAAAALPSPERAYGLLLAANMIWSTIVFAVLRPLPEIAGGRMLLVVMGVLTFAALPVAHLLPGRQTIGRVTKTTASPLSPAAIAGLLATLVFFAGVGSVWPLMERLGASVGATAGRVSDSLSAATLCGIVAGLSSSIVGTRFGRVLPITIGTLSLLGATSLLATMGDASNFLPIVCLFMASWILAVPYYTGLMAGLDGTGRLAAFSMTTQFLGMTLGSGLSSIVGGEQVHPRVEYLGGGLFVAALALVIYVSNRSPGRVLLNS